MTSDTGCLVLVGFGGWGAARFCRSSGSTRGRFAAAICRRSCLDVIRDDDEDDEDADDGDGDDPNMEPVCNARFRFRQFSSAVTLVICIIAALAPILSAEERGNKGIANPFCSASASRAVSSFFCVCRGSKYG